MQAASLNSSWTYQKTAVFIQDNLRTSTQAFSEPKLGPLAESKGASGQVLGGVLHEDQRPPPGRRGADKSTKELQPRTLPRPTLPRYRWGVSAGAWPHPAGRHRTDWNLTAPLCTYLPWPLPRSTPSRELTGPCFPPRRGALFLTEREQIWRAQSMLRAVQAFSHNLMVSFNPSAPILWPPDVKDQLLGKEPDAEKERGQEENRRWLEASPTQQM